LPEELPRLVEGGEGVREELLAASAKRKRRREVVLSLPVPQVIFSDDLEAIGRDIPVDGANQFQGVPLSAGTAEAMAWVLEHSANAVIPDEPYILVCPSTDPAWLPLFVHARGLVMETGGVLSHGAIVARDFGLPAVAGIADVHRRLKTGQRLRIDGATGHVTVLA
jgi:pyruvate,water dikinase